MTTIAASKTEIAGDKQATHNSGMKFKLKTKIFKFSQPLLWPNDFYVGLAGNIDNFPDVLQFFDNPAGVKKPPAVKGGEGIILTQDGKIFTFFRSDSWIAVNQPFYAIGSGMHFAIGAMATGASPSEAVKHASKFDPSTGHGVTKFVIENTKGP